AAVAAECGYPLDFFSGMFLGQGGTTKNRV
ncbi:unnamed protein product, partial [marine sediment metagenome]